MLFCCWDHALPREQACATAGELTHQKTELTGKWVPEDTHVHSAIFDSRPVLGQAQDEQAHVVLLSPSKAESEPSGAPFQLHWETAGTLCGKTEG